MALKKYLCWSFNLSNDTIISYMAGLKTSMDFRGLQGPVSRKIL